MSEPFSDYGPPAPVPIYQHESEFVRALDLYRERKPKRVLEIGSFHGGTLYHWLQNAEPGTVVVSIDSHVAGCDNRALYPDWCPEGVECVSIAGDSHVAATQAEAAKYAPFNWAFIDGGHWLTEVTADWNDYLPMMAPGGVVLFHDIIKGFTEAHPDIQVEALWNQIKEEYKTEEFVREQDSAWGGIGVVYLP